MDTKKWYQSKFVWLGIFQTLSAVALSVAELLQKATITPADIALLLSGVFTIIIRVWFSDTKISL